VLPNCAETKIFVTGNARAWRGFLDQRATPEADAEMRRAAVAILDVLRAESSHIFGDYELYELPGGSRAARTQYRKV
jgi:thymidylate synthase (FAD)